LTAEGLGVPRLGLDDVAEPLEDGVADHAARLPRRVLRRRGEIDAGSRRGRVKVRELAAAVDLERPVDDVE
jgi:hypothetical protein